MYARKRKGMNVRGVEVKALNSPKRLRKVIARLRRAGILARLAASLQLLPALDCPPVLLCRASDEVPQILLVWTIDSLLSLDILSTARSCLHSALSLLPFLNCSVSCSFSVKRKHTTATLSRSGMQTYRLSRSASALASQSFAIHVKSRCKSQTQSLDGILSYKIRNAKLESEARRHPGNRRLALLGLSHQRSAVTS